MLYELLFENQENIIRYDPRLKQENLFIRFGKFGLEPSKIRLDSEFIQDVIGGKKSESGLSVYFAEQNGSTYNIEPPDRKRARYMLDGSYFNDMLQSFLPAIANEEVYLLKGQLIENSYNVYDDAYAQEIEYHEYETGSDGEPLLMPETIKIIKTFSTEEALDYIIYAGRKIGDTRSGLSSKPVRDIIGNYYKEEEEEN